MLKIILSFMLTILSATSWASSLEFFGDIVYKRHGFDLMEDGTPTISDTNKGEWPNHTTANNTDTYDWKDPFHGNLITENQRNRYVLEYTDTTRKALKRVTNIQDFRLNDAAFGGSQELTTAAFKNGKVVSITFCEADTRQKFRNKDGFRGLPVSKVFDFTKAVTGVAEKVQLTVRCDTLDSKACLSLKAVLRDDAGIDKLSKCADDLKSLSNISADKVNQKNDWDHLMEQFIKLNAGTRPVKASLEYVTKTVEDAFKSKTAETSLNSAIYRASKMLRACNKADFTGDTAAARGAGSSSGAVH